MTTTKTTARTATKAQAKKPATSRARTPRPTAKLVPAAPSAYEVGSLYRVAPGDLLIGANVRKNPDLGEAFLESVSALGVLSPVTAFVAPDGLTVWDGQRRVLAAVELKLDTVPVAVIEIPDEATRLAGQVAVNTARDELADGDVREAVRELALFDVPVPAIAKQLAVDERMVAKVARVAKSSTVAKLSKKRSELLSLDAAAAFAELDDKPAVQADLVKLLDEGGSPYQVERKIKRAVLVVEQERLLASAAAAGATVVASEPSYDAINTCRLHDLVDADGQRRWGHNDRIDLAAFIAEFGADAVVFSTEVWDKAKGRETAGLGVALANPGAHGLSNPNGRPAIDKNSADAEAAREERRVARERTKAWEISSARRLEFEQGLVQRAKPPAGWELAVTQFLIAAPNSSWSPSKWRTACVILQATPAVGGGMHYSEKSAVRDALDANPKAPWRVAVAMLLAETEGIADFEKKGWKDWSGDADALLQLLVGWGYVLDEAEQAVVDQVKATKLRKWATS